MSEQIPRRRFRAIWLAPLLAVLALGAWIFASPAGASPDDDYHLVSIWCAAGDRTSLCDETDNPGTRMVSERLVGIACFARETARSAACQDHVLASDDFVETARGNFAGEYPPLYYGVMSIFASDDILTSVLVMRFVNVLLFVAFGTALYLFVPSPRRRTLLWGWLVSIVPLGLFLIASNNPSAWAVIGVGSLPLALLGYFETTGRRRVALGAIAVAATVVAAGARADAAVYAVLVVGGVLVLTAHRSKQYLRRLILPGVLVVIAAALLLSSTQILSGLVGFGGSVASAPGSSHGFAVAADDDINLFSLLISNILNTPSLWAGVFGSWALGWFDTPLPLVVAWGGVGVYVAACFTGLHVLTWRRAIVVAGTGLALWVIPVFTLTRGGDAVGVEVQPRYILPLVVVLAMFALLSAGRIFTRPQALIMAATLVATYAVSIVYNIRRYVTGISVEGADAHGGVDWWWSGLPGPAVVIGVGVLSWAALITVVLLELKRRRAAAAEAAPVSVPSAP